MGKISDGIKTTFEEYKKTGDVSKFAYNIANVADYSVHSQQNADLMYEVIREEANKFNTKECLWYNSEIGHYELLDFDPNGLTKQQIINRAWKILIELYLFKKNDEREVLDSLYLLPVHSLISLK